MKIFAVIPFFESTLLAFSSVLFPNFRRISRCSLRSKRFNDGDFYTT